MRVRFPSRDKLGYWVSSDGRWKAKEHPSGGVTLTDVSRRAVFESTGLSWVRVADWSAVVEVVGAHR